MLRCARGSKESHPGDVLATRGRVACGGISLMAILAVEAPRLAPSFASLPDRGDWAVAGATATCALMAAVPFLLARMAPRAAGFDTQWLPSAPSHWAWFLGMILILLVGGGAATWLARLRAPDPCPYQGLVGDAYYLAHGPATFALVGVLDVFAGPIAQELFWRAYVLEQLRKLTHWSVALLSQALLFALSHWGTLHQQGPLVFIPLFWYGTVLGSWRIRFRSLLPLVLAHVALNSAALVPALWAHYDNSAAVWSKPQLAQIDLLATESAEKAMPALIDFIADLDEVVSAHALEVLGRDFRSEAEPYLKAALASRDGRTVERALFAVELYSYSGLKPQVRAIAWSPGDRTIQAAAILTLRGLEDEEGLAGISREHPNQQLRQVAAEMLRECQARKWGR